MIARRLFSPCPAARYEMEHGKACLVSIHDHSLLPLTLPSLALLTTAPSSSPVPSTAQQQGGKIGSSSVASEAARNAR